MKIHYNLALVFIILLSSNLSASNTNNWETYFENDSVKIEYIYQNCEYIEQFNSEFVILKITNYTNEDLNIEWISQLWYDKNCVNCETKNNENRKKVIISANTNSEGKCNINNNLRLFSKFTEKIEDMPGVKKINILTNFELTNIKVN
tara:strand:- start:19 stop:462 length:444 start_codon:yes stop_codon:yes gene_type:complete